jgi:prepilin-type N-terminal cleavage/methylation domain-containing protein
MLKQKKINLSHKFGFTLVELLITVTILGILSTVAYVGVGEIRKTIRDNKRRADLNEVARALELFKADYGQYPQQNYYSTQVYSGGSWSADANQTMFPILKEGGPLAFAYFSGSGTSMEEKTVQGGYLSEYVKDPINYYNSSSDNSYIYVYWSAAQAFIDGIESTIGLAVPFPLDCPGPSGGTCGVDGGNNAQTWEECCGSGGCFENLCVYSDNGTSDESDDQLGFVSSNVANYGRYCYGSESNRSMALLMTRLERDTKPEERFDNVFAFCPTADPGHPENERYLAFKAIYPKSKPCYNSNDDNRGCVDDVNGTPNFSFGALDDFNYFVPLTGEYNLN